jgi:hypothetical protein
MSAATETDIRGEVTASDGRPEITHSVCDLCWPDIELARVAECGQPLTAVEHVCPDDNSCGCISCVLCELARDEPCVVCGTPGVRRDT